MHKRITAALLTAALALTLAFPGAALADNGNNGQGAAVRGKLTVEGIVTAVNWGASLFIMQVTKPGHANRAGATTLTVLVQQATALKIRGRGDNDDEDDDDDNPAAFRGAQIGDIRVGDRVKVEGFRLDDGRILALKLDVKNRVGGVPGPQPPSVAAAGVVIAKNLNFFTPSLEIASASGFSRVIILITSSTEFHGLRTSYAAIQVGDIISVEGTVNADGSVVARRVDTVTAAGPTTPVPTPGTFTSGVITAKAVVGRFLILNNTLAVNISSNTQISSGGRLRSFNDLQVGQTISVAGTPIVVNGVMVGINAQTITF